MWLVDLVDRSVEVSRASAATDVVRDVIRWRPPTLDVMVSVNLAELFAALG